MLEAEKDGKSIEKIIGKSPKEYMDMISNEMAIDTQALIFGGTAILPIALFVGLIYLNRVVSTPIIEFSNIGSLIIGVIAAFFIIGVSIWARSWTLIIVIGLLILPDFLLNLTSIQYETQLILTTILTFGGIAIYLSIIAKLEKNKKN